MTITFSYAWWYIPAAVTLLAIIFLNWPWRRVNVIAGLGEAAMAMLVVAIAWAVGGALK